MDWQIILAVIVVYFIVVLTIAWKGGSGKPSSIDEYVAANRSLGFIVMYFLRGGAVYSAFAYLGGPGWAYSRGGASYYILAYGALGMMSWWLWAPRTLRAGKKFGFVTQAQLYAGRFQSKTLSVLVAIVSIMAFIQYITIQMKGSGYILELASGGRIPYEVGVLIAYLVVLVYVFFGGVRSVAWTNVFQGAFMVLTAWILGLYFIFTLYDGPADMFRKIAEAKPMHLLVGEGTSMSKMAFASAVIVSFLGLPMWPHLFMKAYTAKDEKTIKQTIVSYPTFAVFLIPVLFIGFAGILQVSPEQLGESDRILPWMFTNANFPPLAIGLVLAAALAAAMSTQDAVTHAAGSIFAQDFVEVLRKKKHTSEEATKVIRISVVAFGAVSYFVAVFGGESLVALLLGAYGSIVQFLPLTVATFFSRRATKQGAICGFAAGVTANFLFSLGVLPLLWDIHAGMLGLTINVIVFIVVSALTQPMDEKNVREYLEI